MTERSSVTYPRSNSSVTTGQSWNEVPYLMILCSSITTYSLKTHRKTPSETLRKTDKIFKKSRFEIVLKRCCLTT